MTQGGLSQEEIDALLKGFPQKEDGNGGEAGPGEGGAAAAGAAGKPAAGGDQGQDVPESSWPPPDMPLEEEDMDVLAEVANISMGSAATAVSALVQRKVVITAPTVSVSTPREVWERFEQPTVVVEVSYIEGLSGRNLFIMRPRDAAVIADLMMGGDGKEPSMDLDELRLSAVSEAMNQMMGASATAMSEFFRLRVNISAPETRLTEAGDRSLLSSQEPMLAVTFWLRIEDLVDSSFVQLMPFPFALDLVKMARQAVAGEQVEPMAPSEGEGLSVTGVSAEPALAGAGVAGTSGGVKGSPQAPAAPGEPVVQRAVFAPLDEPGADGADAASLHNVSLDLIRHIPVEISVSLGHADMSVRDVLRLTTGALVQLNTHERDLVRIYANGVEIARGEVVVVGEQYGVRITDIVTPAQRLSSLRR